MENLFLGVPILKHITVITKRIQCIDQASATGIFIGVNSKWGPYIRGKDNYLMKIVVAPAKANCITIFIQLPLQNGTKYFNPLYTGRLFHCYMLDESICHFRGVWTIMLLLFYF